MKKLEKYGVPSIEILELKGTDVVRTSSSITDDDDGQDEINVGEVWGQGGK